PHRPSFPTRRSSDLFVVNLPAAWNGRFVMLGDGGHDGTVSTSTARIADGYATANSDSGHTAVPGPLQASFAYNNRIGEVDYGFQIGRAHVLNSSHLG